MFTVNNQIAVNLFIACYLLFAVFWDSPESNLLHRALKNFAAPLVRFAGLGHAWNMYAGPFRVITRLETRVRYVDQSCETLPPRRRYEFRRYYFMIGSRDRGLLHQSYLRSVAERLRQDGIPVECIELIRRRWKNPGRVGGILGRFDDAADEQCVETVIAVWKPS